MEKWSASLVKNRIDPHLFEASSPQLAERLKDLKFYCEGVFETPERIAKVKKILQKKAREKPVTPEWKDAVRAILGELQEIQDDLKFAKSNRGKFILFFNDWAQDLYVPLRKDPAFTGITAGANPDKTQSTSSRS